VKKLLLAAVAGAAGLVAIRKAQSGRAEQDLWREVTDPVGPAKA
jgi:hypothetical protein